jgi:peptide methionine sulfoxide reductase msrA/msrB
LHMISSYFDRLRQIDQRFQKMGSGMKTALSVLIILLIGTVGCRGPHGPADLASGSTSETQRGGEGTKLLTATFAGGCFWCTEADFEKAVGVVKVISGYAGGKGANPTYEDFASKGYVQAVQVFYDPHRTSYRNLLDYFWRHINPTDSGGQFIDRGVEYRSIIFYKDDEQRRLAEKSKSDLEKSGRFSKPIVTEILPLTEFYPAEANHQDYYKAHPLRYRIYRNRTGRDEFLLKVWGN